MPKLRKQPRADAAPTFDAILHAAERVLLRDGVAGLTTNKIADVAGVSIGSLYQYFPNKEAIVGALIDRYWSMMFAKIVEPMGEPDRSIGEVLSALAEGLASAYDSLPPIHRHLRDLRAAAGQNSAYDRRIDDITRLVAVYLRQHIALRDPEASAFVIVSAVDGAINAFAVRNGPCSARQLGVELAHMIAGYLGIAIDQ